MAYKLSISGVLHWAFMAVIAMYAFLFRRSWVDYLFIYYTLLVSIQWTIFNGECGLTYLRKKQADPSYIAGQNVDDKDTHILPVSPQINDAVLRFIMVVWIYSLYRVYIRDGFPTWIPILAVLSVGGYNLLIIETTDYVNDRTFQYYQRLTCYTLLVLLAATWYYTKTK